MVDITWADRSDTPGDPNNGWGATHANEVKAAVNSKSDGSHTHATATASAAGFMSPQDKTKLDGMGSGGGGSMTNEAVVAAYETLRPAATPEELATPDESPSVRTWSPAVLAQLIRKIAFSATELDSLEANEETQQEIDDFVAFIIKHGFEMAGRATGGIRPGDSLHYDANLPFPVRALELRPVEFSTSLAAFHTHSNVNPQAPTVIPVELEREARRAVTVPYAATVTLDMATGTNFRVLAAGDLVLAEPVNMWEGKTGRIVVVDDGTDGARSITLTSDWVERGAVTFALGYNAETVLEYFCTADTAIDVRQIGTGTAESLAAPEITNVGTITSLEIPGTINAAHYGIDFTYSGDNVTISRQWQIDGVDVVGETAAEYTPVTSDADKVLTLEYTLTNASGQDVATTPGVTIVASRSVEFSGVVGAHNASTKTFTADQHVPPPIDNQVFIINASHTSWPFTKITADGLELTDMTPGASVSAGGKTLTCLAFSVMDTHNRQYWFALEGHTGNGPVITTNAGGAQGYLKMYAARITGYDISQTTAYFASQNSNDSTDPIIAVDVPENALLLMAGNKVHGVSGPPNVMPLFVADGADEAWDVLFAYHRGSAYNGNVTFIQDGIEPAKLASCLVIPAL